jgi:hypothetical protein
VLRRFQTETRKPDRLHPGERGCLQTLRLRCKRHPPIPRGIKKVNRMVLL